MSYEPEKCEPSALKTETPFVRITLEYRIVNEEICKNYIRNLISRYLLFIKWFDFIFHLQVNDITKLKL